MSLSQSWRDLLGMMGRGARRRAEQNRRSPRRLVLESLETRKLMSVSPSAPIATCGAAGSEDSPPVARDDAYAMRGNRQLGADVLANDSAPDGGRLTVALVDGASHGKLVLGADGRFTYTPDRNFTGADRFTYQDSNGRAVSGTATVDITITGGQDNAAPVGQADSYHMTEDQTLSVDGPGVLANDTSADHKPLGAVLVSGPRHGTLVLGTDGSFDYTPKAGFSGDDSFVYKASDGVDTSAPVTATITVDPVNHPPSAKDDSYSVTQDQPLTVPAKGVLGNDADPDGDPLTAAVVAGPSNGTAKLNADGSFDYTPKAGFVGTDTFTYKANDGQADSNVATVTIAVNRANAAPSAKGDHYSVTQDQTLSVPAKGVLGNDADPDGDPLMAAVVAGPSNGTLKLNADGSFDYTPKAGFVGTDTFTYKGNDGQADSNVATVTIAVNRANAAPSAKGDHYSVTQDQTLSVPAKGVLGNDADPDGDPLTAAVVAGPSNGTLKLNADGSFDYTPNAGFFGEDTFTYKANDGQADSNVATVTIAVNRANAAPSANDDHYSVTQDQTLTAPAKGVLANDADPDGDPLTAAVVAGPSNGTLKLNADGSFDYTPKAGFVGTDSFTYKANDGQADSNVATVTIAVNRAHAAPAAKEMKIDLGVSGRPFGADAGPIWGGSTFWVSAYVQDLRDVPQGVVGGAFDLQYDAASVTPTGRVVYGDQFTAYRQGAADPAAGMIDETGALTTHGGVGANGEARFVAWEFRRNGSGAPNDRNTHVAFAADPSEGTGKITPGNFALVGLGAPIDWPNVQLGSVGLDLNLGDFNGNGLVNQGDLALWISHAFSSEGQPRFDPQFDLNGDGRVNDADLNLLMPRLYRSINADPPALSDRPEGTEPHGHAATGRRLDPHADLDWVGPSLPRPQSPAGPPARHLAVDAVLAREGWHG